MIRTLPPCQFPRLQEYTDGLQRKLKKQQITKDQSGAASTLSEIKRIKSHWTIVQNPYAVTTHKSQGSTIENVYLDTLSFCRAPNRRALLYVGISRASRNLHVVRVPKNMALDSKQVNDRYRQARQNYKDVIGKPYAQVINYLGVSTGNLEGKLIVAEYLESVVEDVLQGE
jgi:hypothetical protein